MRIPTLISTILLAGVAALPVPARAVFGANSTPAPTVRLVGRQTLVGQDWPHGDHVTVWADNGGAVRVAADRTGKFETTMTGNNPCVLLAGAIDASGRHAMVRSPFGRACPPRFRHILGLTVIRGARLPMPHVTVYAPAPTSTINVRLGDAVVIWEPGDMQPAYQAASEDSDALRLVHTAHNSAQDCSGMPNATPADCNAGFWWIWVALQSGVTNIDLAPSCRSARPPCMQPDRMIQVHVTESSVARNLHRYASRSVPLR